MCGLIPQIGEVEDNCVLLYEDGDSIFHPNSRFLKTTRLPTAEKRIQEFRKGTHIITV
jgi:hypothetical protein